MKDAVKLIEEDFSDKNEQNILRTENNSIDSTESSINIKMKNQISHLRNKIRNKDIIIVSEYYSPIFILELLSCFVPRIPA